jgi:peptidoglycan hydrolase CwlO-like protein
LSPSDIVEYIFTITFQYNCGSTIITKEIFMSTRDEFIRRMQAKLEEWNADIDSLTARAGEASEDLKREYDEQIALLKAKHAAAQQKIAELQQESGSAWEDLKAGIELAWTAIGEAIDSAKSRFK